MTNVAVLERERGHELSEAGASFQVREVLQTSTAIGDGVQTMTTAGAMDYISSMPYVRSARPTGIARLVMRASVAMFTWAARRAVKLEHNSDEQRRIMFEARARESREHAALLLRSRVR